MLVLIRALKLTPKIVTGKVASLVKLRVMASTNSSLFLPSISLAKHLWLVTIHQSLGGLLKFLNNFINILYWINFFYAFLSCTTAWLVTGLLALNLVPWDTAAWHLVQGGCLPGLTSSEVDPNLTVDGAGQDVVCGKEVLVTAVITGMAVELAPLVEGWLMFFSALWGLGSKVSLLPIAKLTNFFKIALKK